MPDLVLAHWTHTTATPCGETLEAFEKAAMIQNAKETMVAWANNVDVAQESPRKEDVQPSDPIDDTEPDAAVSRKLSAIHPSSVNRKSSASSNLTDRAKASNLAVKELVGQFERVS